jgi:hypothetical protein
MHPALHSWREDLPRAFVRLLAYVGGAAVLSMAAAQFVQHRAAVTPAPPAAKPQWVDIERVFPAFALSLPEAAEVPAHYAVRRNVVGNGRMDILTLGEADSADPYLVVRIYRPGTELYRVGLPQIVIAEGAADLAPVNVRAPSETLDSKFGPLSMVTFDAGKGTPRHCLAFVRAWDDPKLQLSGWFCRGGSFVQRSTPACALDRLTLLSAGSEPKIGALFAKAELNRNFCGQRDAILAPTPKYRLLWKALEDHH